MDRIVIQRGQARRRRRRGRLAATALLMTAASCVPASLSPPVAGLSVSPPIEAPVSLAELPVRQALAASANPPAAPFLPHGGARDELRSLDCLTAAIYYEAASEPEAGQRAVAQVVLNRVRHPDYPNSVCGVVFQGPMRAGPEEDGGCQFTFTCDGSLLRRPAAAGWASARRIAADALTGEVYAPVGLATHYHADYVLPGWAPALAKVAAIGAHIFYRLPGSAGAPGAFLQRYSGREPLPVPATYRTARLPRIDSPKEASAAATVKDRLPEGRYTESMPVSRVREQYLNSGTPLADLR